MKLAEAIENSVEGHRRILVLGADADELHKEIRDVLHKVLPQRRGSDVLAFCDFRQRVPDTPEIVRQIGTGIRHATIVHVAARAPLSPRLLGILISPETYLTKEEIRGSIALSTPTTDLALIEVALRERFRFTVSGGEHNSPWVPPHFRQAVVLIHGIGEQSPMQSVKGFAKAVLPSQPGIAEKYTSYPVDWSTQLFKLTKVLLEGR